MSVKKTYTIINSRGEVTQVEKVEKKGTKRKALPFPAQYMNLGFYLVTPILFGIFVGKFLDNKFDSGTLYTTTLIIFGTIATFYNLFKFIKDATDNTSSSN